MREGFRVKLKNSISQRIYSTDQVRGQVDDLRSNLEFFQKSQVSSKTDKFR